MSHCGKESYFSSTSKKTHRGHNPKCGSEEEFGVECIPDDLDFSVPN